jgi:hypothetical protein
MLKKYGIKKFEIEEEYDSEPGTSWVLLMYLDNYGDIEVYCKSEYKINLQNIQTLLEKQFSI